MSLRRVLIIFFLAFICQLSVVNMFAIGGVTPNLILCMTICLVYYYPEGYKAIPIATVAMLLLDMCSAQYMGVGALSLFAVSFFVILCRVNLNTERLFPTLVTAGITVVLFYSLRWAIMALLGSDMGFGYMLLHTIGYLIYSLAACALIYAFVSGKIIKKKPKMEREEEVELVYDIED